MFFGKDEKKKCKKVISFQIMYTEFKAGSQSWGKKNKITFQCL